MITPFFAGSCVFLLPAMPALHRRFLMRHDSAPSQPGQNTRAVLAATGVSIGATLRTPCRLMPSSPSPRPPEL